MNVPVWAVELATRFWLRAGPVPAFPRDLTGPVAFALPLSVVQLSGLTVERVRDWLERIKLLVPIAAADRPLRACLVCRGPAGVVFLDADDPADERRFSLAHEAAHYLRDHEAPRDRLGEKLGSAALDVCDGRRPATFAERLSAVWRGVTATAQVHLLSRDDAGRPRSAAEADAEAAADRLAFELLAPAAALPAGVTPELLVRDFGLPPSAAAAYLKLLQPDVPTEAFITRWRLHEDRPT